METRKELPTVLVIGNSFENWYDLCSPYKDLFIVEQATWDEISLMSCSDVKFPYVTLGPSLNPNCERQKETRRIQPSLILIRMFSRYIGHRLGKVPDYRNILYGFVHACVPMINSINAVLAELEKPLMYGRLHYIEKLYGSDVFPLIKQYYYPEHAEMHCPPPAPFVLKVGFPHAGYGKIRVHDSEEFEDIKSIIAINNDYSAVEPLIDSEYELRIVYVAPDYYRVHKRIGFSSWKINFGMASERQEIDMTPKYKKWVDLIVQHFPDMETFCIDAIVDKNGREYILEVNGSAQGFAPEHGIEDLQHLTQLVVRRVKEITEQSNNEIIDESNEALEKEDKDVQIINLKNKIEHLQRIIKNSQKITDNVQTDSPPKRKSYSNVFIVVFIILIFCLHLLI
ncbi:Synapsin, ATP binding domain containing protein [Tritrichomonas foetus]|uniref:Synapsin, ATP binding domain containing protein n=1 Tax=Tritrichomonas foetus TaxID=1144522 RepID=A0A1J4K803_9EUKA|nr:Synapsin, ATP binding domain containing protein [Tritrichomonas foetus]|eukprot:OHT07008.1 Synapsin, ATP binding domain containing protein [Tritrichomonas foetus]